MVKLLKKKVRKKELSGYVWPVGMSRSRPIRYNERIPNVNVKNWFPKTRRTGYFILFFYKKQKYGHVNKIYKWTELRLPATYIDCVYNVLKDSANER
jgi:hypothetical protein